MSFYLFIKPRLSLRALWADLWYKLNSHQLWIVLVTSKAYLCTFNIKPWKKKQNTQCDRGTHSIMSLMVWVMICFTLSVSSSAIPCSPMLNDASLVLPSYLHSRRYSTRSQQICEYHGYAKHVVKENGQLLKMIYFIHTWDVYTRNGHKVYTTKQLVSPYTHPTTEEKSVPILGSMRAL